ncbi:glycine--tRNA ligase beta subunit [Thalassobacillus devorans]|uniref:Glycine--tRNA ligase beta subunit n=1 Tax=Thalassobacillus devorans TaxID=279813 RepID=A0ABQ1P6W1_9BACI|nr:glycine--tRNA ligase subunit beta [Thalassobacillus devorans]NIK29684.1 glycyl-tRNA synthetase beta chain [Thalassobacillus devorans]GGC91998.1 glycine--tRNA ligase beta subunit [Thalassobacillus devorans]
MSNTVLFEVGLEELPARFIDDALVQLEEKTKQWLDDLRLPYDTIATMATPRRLTVKVEGLADKQPDIEEEAKGPAKKIAIDEEGNWTKAAIGFSKGQGKGVDDIYFKEIKGTEYVHVNKYTEGEPTKNLLSQFSDLILSLNFPKNMRWGSRQLRYARPIRWLAALYNDEVIPFSIEDVQTGKSTYGHRFLGEKVEVEHADEYEMVLQEQYVIVDVAMRKEMIATQIEKLAQEKNWNILVDEDLLSEVTHLVEYPTVFYGEYSEDFLIVPEEALITSMKEHQRYFPVRAKTGELLPFFVAVRNGDEKHLDNVARGNEKVLKARLADARFFYEEDQKASIEKNLDKLSRMVFQEDLGTIADKVQRTIKLADALSDHLKLQPAIKKQVLRTAEISKFDLVTHMVGEFPELQGIMGEKYARIFGEDEEVAQAINEHYMPRHANGELPKSIPGTVVSIADKLDTIVGCFSIGIIPSGSQDPYGLRRSAIGILQMLDKQAWDIQLETLVNSAVKLYISLGLPNRSEEEVVQDLNEFFHIRASYLLKEEGVEPDIVEAVLANGIKHVPFTKEKAKLLASKRNDESFKSTHEALGRVLNLAKKTNVMEVDTELFENETEQTLYNTYLEVKQEYAASLSRHDAVQALKALGMLADPIHNFFDHTMVMAEDAKIKENRLGLLNLIATEIYAFADLNAVQWKQQY